MILFLLQFHFQKYIKLRGKRREHYLYEALPLCDRTVSIFVKRLPAKQCRMQQSRIAHVPECFMRFPYCTKHSRDESTSSQPPSNIKINKPTEIALYPASALH